MVLSPAQSRQSQIICWYALLPIVFPRLCSSIHFLCGPDTVTGKSYEHRRGWVEARYLFFNFPVRYWYCRYAVNGAITSVVVCVDKKGQKAGHRRSGLCAGIGLYKVTLLRQKYARHDELSESEQLSWMKRSVFIASRFIDISWFMRKPHEYIAREAK